jgi:hypothetical protein
MFFDSLMLHSSLYETNHHISEVVEKIRVEQKKSSKKFAFLRYLILRLISDFLILLCETLQVILFIIVFKEFVYLSFMSYFSYLLMESKKCLNIFCFVQFFMSITGLIFDFFIVLSYFWEEKREKAVEWNKSNLANCCKQFAMWMESICLIFMIL